MYSKSRIQLLSNQEIESIYAMPQFNKTERELYFSLTDNEMRLVKKYRTIKAKVYFIRLLGYFKAKQQFYKFDLAHNNVDTQNILEKYLMIAPIAAACSGTSNWSQFPTDTSSPC